MTTKSEGLDLELKAAACAYGEAYARVGESMRALREKEPEAYRMWTENLAKLPPEQQALSNACWDAQQALEKAARAVHAATPVAVNVRPQREDDNVFESGREQ